MKYDKKYQDQENDAENDDKYVDRIFLEVTIKKIYFATKNSHLPNFEMKYVKFDYDSQIKIPDTILEKSESIYCNNKIIFSDDGVYTNYAKSIYDSLNFQNLTFLEFSSFLCYLFDTDYEVDPKLYINPDETSSDYSSDCDENTENKDDILNYDEEYNQNDKFDCIYDVMHEFNMLIKTENKNNLNIAIEYLISVLNKYLKKNLFSITQSLEFAIMTNMIENNFVNYDKMTLPITLSDKLPALIDIVNNENLNDICYFVDKITNIKYNVYNSKLYDDDICKIISFDIFHNDIINIKYVLFGGISHETWDYHLQSIENIYANEQLIIYNKKETTNYANELYKKFNFDSITFDKFISFIYLLFTKNE